VIYTTFCKEDRGREIVRGSYPFPLMSKGERDNHEENHEDRGSMSVSSNVKGGD
jgi:hypothetical protein